MTGKKAPDGEKIPTLAGKKWGTMTDDDKKKYEEMVEKDKNRYEKEMAEWKKTVCSVRFYLTETFIC